MGAKQLKFAAVFLFATILLLVLIFTLVLPQNRAWKPIWEPLYTGQNEMIWDYDDDSKPWGFGSAYRSENQYFGNKAYGELIEEYPNIAYRSGGYKAWPDDFAGSYRNNSGSLTILLYLPTVERAEYYGKLCGYGIWIIEAQYSYDMLFKGTLEAEAIIDKLSRDYPKAEIGGGANIDDIKNRVVIRMTGIGIDKLVAYKDIPDYMEFELSVLADTGAEDKIPYEPETVYKADDDLIIAMDRTYYPVNARYISYTITNKSDLWYGYGYKGVLYKYVDGEWLRASSLPSGTDESYGLPPHRQRTIFFSKAYLGIGLYRIFPSGISVKNSFMDYYLEFAVTKDAEPLIPIDEAEKQAEIENDREL